MTKKFRINFTKFVHCAAQVATINLVGVPQAKPMYRFHTNFKYIFPTTGSFPMPRLQAVVRPLMGKNPQKSQIPQVEQV